VHRFLCYLKGAGKSPPDLRGAHLLGTDNVPVRGEIRWQDGEIRCTPRTQDPVGLSLLWPVAGFGTIQLQTTRLPARDKPYHLHVELARHQLMRISVKREEWGLYDYNGMEDIAGQIDTARDAFLASVEQSEQPDKAAQLADQALAGGLVAGEEMSRFHANIFLGRRRQSGGFNRPFLGICAPIVCKNPAWARSMGDTFQFVRLPFVWRDIQPTEQVQQYDAVDAAIKLCSAAGLSLRGGPLLNFGVRSVPDWMYIWENDFEAIYEAAREHVERTVQRFGKQIPSWVVATGLHADNVFGFSFEQIMELTRMAAAVTKQVAPRTQVLIDICQPWGEYYARNQQTVPPLLYADMVVQSGINFDAFGLQFLCGIESDGYHVRDLFQVSALIDKVANFGKPIHITALGAPSTLAKSTGEATPGGEWRGPWTDEIQAEWLTAVCEVALSKPYVETVCLQPLVDSGDDVIPTGGLLRDDLVPKPALKRLAQMRERLISGNGK
jgi:hypothetical protein